MGKTGGDLPIEKLKTQEEIEFERKLGSELKRQGIKGVFFYELLALSRDDAGSGVGQQHLNKF